MDIEVVEFYTLDRDDKKQTITGTMHVYLIDYDIDLRGVLVKKQKDRWFFHMPHKKALDEDNNRINYPVVTFANSDKQKQLIQAVISKGKEFIKRECVL